MSMLQRIKSMKKRMIMMIIVLSFLSTLFINSNGVLVNADEESGAEQTAVSEYALSWDGHTEMPYIFGGPGGRSGPMTLEECSEQGVGFDCSGFTSMVYRHFGIEIPAQSEAQMSAAVAVYYSEEDAVPGDIAWWQGHVAIYIGNGKIVHTNTSRPPTNYPHVSTFAGEGANYRAPAAYLRMVENVADLGEPENSDEAEENVEEAVGYGSMITESDLTGMPIKSTLVEEQQRLQLMDRSALTSYDIANLDYIQEALKADNPDAATWYGVATSAVGLFCIIYAILLVMAYMLDYSNQFINFSLLNFISFGKFRIIDWDDYHSGLIDTGYNSARKVTYLTKGMLATRVIILVVIGCLLLSGFIGDTIATLVSNIFGLG